MVKKFNEYYYYKEDISFPNTEEEIREVCKEYFISADNYTINEDMSIDVKNQYVNFACKNLTLLPLKFNMVESHFGCSSNRLISLEGCPNYVGGNFFCSKNFNLYTFDGCPDYIDEQCYVHSNKPINEIFDLFHRTRIKDLIESWNKFSPVYRKDGIWYLSESKFHALYLEVIGDYYAGGLDIFNSYKVDYDIGM